MRDRSRICNKAAFDADGGQHQLIQKTFFYRENKARIEPSHDSVAGPVKPLAMARPAITGFNALT